MADPDPRDRGSGRTLSLKPRHRRFLHQVLETVREGLLDDLTERGDRLRDPERSRREAHAYGRLLAALNAGAVVPDHAQLVVLAELAQGNDKANEYERVAAEHEAFCELLTQIARAVGDAR